MKCWCSHKHAGSHAAYRAKRHKYYLSRRAEILRLRRANYEASAERYRAYKRKWTRKNPEYVRQYRKENGRRITNLAIANLQNWYVVRVLRKSGCRGPIPRVLIEAKRAQLMLHRLANHKE